MNQARLMVIVTLIVQAFCLVLIAFALFMLPHSRGLYWWIQLLSIPINAANIAAQFFIRARWKRRPVERRVIISGSQEKGTRARIGRGDLGGPFDNNFL